MLKPNRTYSCFGGDLYPHEMGALDFVLVFSRRAWPVVAVLALGALAFKGEPPTHYTSEEKASELRARVVDRQLDGSAAQNFRDRFVKPVKVSAQLTDGGSGILGWFGRLDSPKITISAGGSCLGGSVYDRSTDDLKPGISATAFTVPPAVGGAEQTLIFAMNEAGGLIPDEKTLKILGAYGCSGKEGTVVPVALEITGSPKTYEATPINIP